MKGIIVGIQENTAEYPGKIYRVILYKRENNDTKYSKQQIPEHVLTNMLQNNSIHLDNAALVGGKIKGTTGELSRFTANKDFHPMVILSEIVAVVGLGYVGMPIAVALAKKVDVIGFDTNKAKIE